MWSEKLCEKVGGENTEDLERYRDKIWVRKWRTKVVWDNRVRKAEWKSGEQIRRQWSG